MEVLNSNIANDMYRISLLRYRDLYNSMSHLQEADVIEEYELKKLLKVNEEGLSLFENKLKHYFHDFRSSLKSDLSKKNEHVQISSEKNELLLPETLSDHTDMEMILCTEKYHENKLRELFIHLRGDMAKIKFAKIYRAISLASALEIYEESLPEFVVKMISLLIDSVFQLRSRECMNTKTMKIHFLRYRLLVQRKDDFDSFLTYYLSKWEGKLNDGTWNFPRSPQNFTDLISGFREVSRQIQDLTFKEYYRTNVMIVAMTNFLQREHSALDIPLSVVHSVHKIIDILKESFQFIQGVDVSSHFSDDHIISLYHNFVIASLNKLLDALMMVPSMKSTVIDKNYITTAIEELHYQKENESLSHTFGFPEKSWLRFIMDQGSTAKKYHVNWEPKKISFSDGTFSYLPLFLDEITEASLLQLKNKIQQSRDSVKNSGNETEVSDSDNESFVVISQLDIESVETVEFVQNSCAKDEKKMCKIM